jgi:hypothetical protein
MNAQEIDRIVFRLTAAWPRPPIPIETLAIWNEHLRPLKFEYGWNALLRLELTKSRQPSLAEFHEAYGAVRPTAEQMRAIEPDDQWDGPEKATENLKVLQDAMLAIRKTLPSDLVGRPMRLARQQYPTGSPALRSGTKTGRSPEFRLLRYDEVYDENGKPR